MDASGNILPVLEWEVKFCGWVMNGILIMSDNFKRWKYNYADGNLISSNSAEVEYVVIACEKQSYWGTIISPGFAS